MAVTGEYPQCGPGLLLLADTSEMVSADPSLLEAPLVAELCRRRYPWSAPGAKAGRPPRATKISKKVGNSDGLNGKKNGRQEGVCKKKREKIGEALTRGPPAASMKRELPSEVRAKITEDRSGTDVKLILQKKLTESDLNPRLGRFSLPSSLILTEFLDQGERRFLENGGVITVPVIEPNLGVSYPTLKSWKMSTLPFYVFTSGWNDIARNNDLEAGDLIQVWSFRTEGRIGFAMVKCKDDDVTAAASGDHQAVGSQQPSSPSSVLELPPY